MQNTSTFFYSTLFCHGTLERKFWNRNAGMGEHEAKSEARGNAERESLPLPLSAY